jgi:hypothetical protein
MMIPLEITIVHEIPGRLRLRLSTNFKNPENMKRSVKLHPGIKTIQFSDITKSLLLEFEPAEIQREELLIRVGMALSLENNANPVKILSKPFVKEIKDSAYYSGFMIMTAFLSHLFRLNPVSYSLLHWSAGLGTAFAALEHGWDDIQREGNFHPEVLSVAYLLVALVRGNFLPATVFTWISTFGRHLVSSTASGIEISPTRVGEDHSKKPQYEMIISPIKIESNRMRFFNLLPSLIMFAVTGKQPSSPSELITEINRVSKLHGEVLEGLGEYKDGIPLKIRKL